MVSKVCWERANFVERPADLRYPEFLGNGFGARGVRIEDGGSFAVQTARNACRWLSPNRSQPINPLRALSKDEGDVRTQPVVPSKRFVPP